MQISKEELRQIIKEELSLVLEQDLSPVSRMLTSLGSMQQTDRFGEPILVLDYGNCKVVLKVEVIGEVLWVESLDVVGNDGRPNPECFRKGYASEMMKLLTQAADDHGVTIKLIAAPPPRIRRQFPELPDARGLANFYSKHGFVEISNNPMQVEMTRTPSN